MVSFGLAGGREAARNFMKAQMCIRDRGGYMPGNGEPRQVPIIQSTTFKYATSEDMGKPVSYTHLKKRTAKTVISY